MTTKKKIILFIALIAVGYLFIDDEASVRNRLEPHYSGYDYYMDYITYMQLSRPIPS